MTGGRRCVFCGRKPATNEHVFRATRKKTFGRLLENAPGDPIRTFTQPGGQIVTRPGNPFDQQVRRACSMCNNGWMNELDKAVEPTLLRIGLGQGTRIPAAEIATWRLWAIKTAMMRSFVDQSVSDHLPGDEFAAVLEGRVPEGWHVSVGRCTEPTLQDACYGMIQEIKGPVHAGMQMGFVQVSWAMGRLLVVVCRAVSPPEIKADLGFDFWSNFEKVNRSELLPLVELTESIDEAIDLLDHPPVATRRLPSMFAMFADVQRQLWLEEQNE